MLHTLRFSLQNGVYFITLPFLVPVLFTFYIQVCYNLNVKLRCQNVNDGKMVSVGFMLLRREATRGFLLTW